MAGFWSNLHVLGADRASTRRAVIAAFAADGYKPAISDPFARRVQLLEVGKEVMVVDEAFDDDFEALERFGKALSRVMRQTVVAINVHDGDLLIAAAFRAGRPVAHLVSDANYFRGAGPRRPTGAPQAWAKLAEGVEGPNLDSLRRTWNSAGELEEWLGLFSRILDVPERALWKGGGRKLRQADTLCFAPRNRPGWQIRKCGPSQLTFQYHRRPSGGLTMVAGWSDELEVRFQNDGGSFRGLGARLTAPCLKERGFSVSLSARSSDDEKLFVPETTVETGRLEARWRSFSVLGEPREGADTWESRRVQTESRRHHFSIRLRASGRSHLRKVAPMTLEVFSLRQEARGIRVALSISPADG